VTDPDALVPDDEEYIDPASLEPLPRLRGVALALAVVLGFIGAHRFYVGKAVTGILQLCTLGGLGLWWLYDAILIGTGEFTDKQGRLLLKWNRNDDPLVGGRDTAAVAGRGGRLLRGQVASLPAGRFPERCRRSGGAGVVGKGRNRSAGR
jgi:TM2 domain-containing membrane protein YozV